MSSSSDPPCPVGFRPPIYDHLNRMEGPTLTLSDVQQRLIAFEEERYSELPHEEFEDGCLAIYEAEKAGGTEMPAIVGVLRQHVEREEERHRSEQGERYKRLKDEQRVAAEQQLVSGSDCKWTPWSGTKDVYCRLGGRLFRLSTRDDKFLDLFRVAEIATTDGRLLGRYMKLGTRQRRSRRLPISPKLRCKTVGRSAPQQPGKPSGFRPRQSVRRTSERRMHFSLC